MKQLKTLILITLVLICTGCASSLGEVTNEDITYDMTKGFDINDIVSNVSEGTDVDYTIDEDNNKLIITLTNGDKTETIEKDITIEKPVIEVSDGITYDTYTKETDVDDHITKPDSTTYDYTIDEDNSTITINFTDGEYKETVDKTIEITDSNPYPKTYYCYDAIALKYAGDKYGFNMTIDGNDTATFTWDGQYISGTFTSTYKSGYVNVGDDMGYIPITFANDETSASIQFSHNALGEPACYVCSLIQD